MFVSSTMRVLAFSSLTQLDSAWAVKVGVNCSQLDLESQSMSLTVRVLTLSGEPVLELSPPADATVGTVMQAVIASQNSPVRFPYLHHLSLGEEVLDADTFICHLTATSESPNLDLLYTQLPESAMSKGPEDADRLIDAVEKGDVAQVKEILRTPVHPDAVDNDGRTALYCATRFEVVETLVEAGSDVNQDHLYGHSLLHVVGTLCPSTSLEKVQFLCKHGADVRKTVLEYYEAKAQDQALDMSFYEAQAQDRARFARDELTKSLAYLQSVEQKCARS